MTRGSTEQDIHVSSSSSSLKRSASEILLSPTDTKIRIDQEEETVIIHDNIETRLETHLSLTATWNGKKYPVSIPPTSTIGDLKLHLADHTQVQPTRQKLIGFVKGKLPEDHVVLETLSLKENHTFMMMGTVEHQIFKRPDEKDLPVVANDLDVDAVDYMPDDSNMHTEKNIKKLREYTEKVCVCDQLGESER